MITFSATTIRNNLFNILNDVIKKHKQYRIKYKDENIILINENDYENLLETLELLSSPDFKQKLKTSEKQIKEGRTYKFEEVF